MFNRHLLKVILSFCAVILAGLTFLVVLDSLKAEETASVINANIPPPISPNSTPPKKTTPQPIKKPATTSLKTTR